MENNNKTNTIEILNKDINPTVSINGDSELFAVSLYTERIMEEKQLIKFIKSAERLIRSSPEYRELIFYMRDELNLNHCTYLNSIDIENGSIEFHHTPYNLFQIIQILVNKHEIDKTPFNTLLLANEALALHYQNLIGLCTLSKTMHELVHSNEKFQIHKDLVIGDVESFYNMFKNYMTDELKAVYNDWITYSNEHEEDKLNTMILFDKEIREAQLTKINSLNTLSKSTNNNITSNDNTNNNKAIDIINEDELIFKE